MAIDTDYKTGSTTNDGDSKWDGWSVDPARIPDMTGLLADWHAEGIHNTLNIHPSISSKDPKFAQAQATAKGKLTKGRRRPLPVRLVGPRPAEGLLRPAHVDAARGRRHVVARDWCCSENSKYSANGVTPDAFITSSTRRRRTKAPRRPRLAFSRRVRLADRGRLRQPAGGPHGAVGDKRTTVHFTATPRRRGTCWRRGRVHPGESAATGLAVGQPRHRRPQRRAVRHRGRRAGHDPAARGPLPRWCRLGTFQPIDRLHSNHSDRLPWQYPAAANASAKQFLNLREDLLPLTYTLAAQATATGTPILQPLYLQYPEAQQSYAQAGSEYLYGADVLVAPVTTANDADTGTATRSVWFPAGSSWTDWFTGKTYAGGTTADVTTGLDSMPVFVKSGWDRPDPLAPRRERRGNRSTPSP